MGDVERFVCSTCGALAQEPGTRVYAFEPGDVVQLKSGGPLMTVNDALDGKLSLIWADALGGHAMEVLATAAKRAQPVADLADRLKAQELGVRVTKMGAHAHAGTESNERSLTIVRCRDAVWALKEAAEKRLIGLGAPLDRMEITIVQGKLRGFQEACEAIEALKP